MHNVHSRIICNTTKEEISHMFIQHKIDKCITVCCYYRILHGSENQQFTTTYNDIINSTNLRLGKRSQKTTCYVIPSI